MSVRPRRLLRRPVRDGRCRYAPHNPPGIRIRTTVRQIIPISSSLFQKSAGLPFYSEAPPPSLSLPHWDTKARTDGQTDSPKATHLLPAPHFAALPPLALPGGSMATIGESLRIGCLCAQIAAPRRGVWGGGGGMCVAECAHLKGPAGREGEEGGQTRAPYSVQGSRRVSIGKLRKLGLAGL